MFEECNSLVDISNLEFKNPFKVSNISFMFYNCIKIKKIPEKFNFKPKMIKDMSYMFYNCKDLEIKNNFDISNFISANKSNIFTGCKSKRCCIII